MQRYFHFYIPLSMSNTGHMFPTVLLLILDDVMRSWRLRHQPYGESLNIESLLSLLRLLLQPDPQGAERDGSSGNAAR